MTIHMNIARAKARLSELVALAESGEDVVISRAGKPAVRLARVTSPPSDTPRVLGFWAHLGSLTDPELFLRDDPELEEIVNESIFPER